MTQATDRLSATYTREGERDVGGGGRPGGGGGGACSRRLFSPCSPVLCPQRTLYVQEKREGSWQVMRCADSVPASAVRMAGDVFTVG